MFTEREGCKLPDSKNTVWTFSNLWITPAQQEDNARAHQSSHNAPTKIPGHTKA